MKYGIELLNKVNTMIDNNCLTKNYQAKKEILENGGYEPIGYVNYIENTLTQRTVWVSTKDKFGNDTDVKLFESDVNYWTGEKGDTKVIKLQDSDFNIQVIHAIDTDNLKIEMIKKSYKNESALLMFKVTTKDNKIFYSDMYNNYSDTKGIKGIKAIKKEVEEIDFQELFNEFAEEYNLFDCELSF